MERAERMEKSQRKELRRRFDRLGLLLIASQVVMLAVVYGLEFLQMHALSALHPAWPRQDLLRAVYESGWTLILGAGAAIAPLFLLREDKPAHWLCTRTRALPPPRMALLFLLVMGLQLTASILTVPFEWLANQMGGSFLEAGTVASAASVTPSMLLYTVLFAPLSEELIYRGFVLHHLRPQGTAFAIVVSAVLFGLMHGNVIQLPMAILCGSLFGYVACEYSLAASIVLHSLTNLSVELIGWVSAADEISGGILNGALTSFGLIALLLCASRFRTELAAYWRAGRSQKGTVRCLLTAPLMVLLMLYLLVLTVMSITPLNA